MRVNYTLPGLLPGDPGPVEPARPGDSPFRSRLNFVPAPRWESWECLLSVDGAPVNAASIGPPPSPEGFEPGDPSTERLLWRQMLDRHVAALGGSGSGAAQPGSAAIGRMLALLERFRDVEDDIAARRLAEPEA